MNFDVKRMLLLSLKGVIPKIRVSQTFLNLANFIEKSKNIYDIK